MTTITIYTDGSSLGNPGPGGYSALILDRKTEKIIKGGEKYTTNNRMEMMAIITALEWVKKNTPAANIQLYSDSNLLIQSLNKNWKRKKNLDLWQRLDAARKDLQATFHWIKGHANHQHNNRCDRIAVEEARKWQRSYT